MRPSLQSPEHSWLASADDGQGTSACPACGSRTRIRPLPILSSTANGIPLLLVHFERPLQIYRHRNLFSSQGSGNEYGTQRSEGDISGLSFYSIDVCTVGTAS